MATSPQRKPPRSAYCEDYNEDENTTVPGTRHTATANVAAKRSKPDFPKLKIPGQYEASDSGYSSQTAATAGTGDLVIQTSNIIANQSNSELTPADCRMIPPTMSEKGKERSKGEKKSSIPSSIIKKLSITKKPKEVPCNSPDCPECAENIRPSGALATTKPRPKSARRTSTSHPQQIAKGPPSPSKRAAPMAKSLEGPATVRFQAPTQARPRPEYPRSYTEGRPINVHAPSPSYPFSYQDAYPVTQPHQPMHSYPHPFLQTPTTTTHERFVHYPADICYVDRPPSQAQFPPYTQVQPPAQAWPNPNYPQPQLSRPRRATMSSNQMPAAERIGRVYAVPSNYQNPHVLRDHPEDWYHSSGEQEFYAVDHRPRRQQSVQQQSRPRIHPATTPVYPTLHHPHNSDRLHERDLRKQSLEDGRPASRPALVPKRYSAVVAVDPSSTKQRTPVINHRDPSPVKHHRSRPISHPPTGGLEDKIQQVEDYITPMKHLTIEDTKKIGRKTQTNNSGVSEAGSRNSGSSDGKKRGAPKTLRHRRESDLKSRRSENVEDEGLNVRFNAGQYIQLEFKGNTGNNRLIEFKPSPDGEGEVQLMIGGKGGQSRSRYGSVASRSRGRSGTSEYRKEPASRVGRDVSRVKEGNEGREVKHEQEPRRTRDEGTSTAETGQIHRVSNERSPEEERTNRFQTNISRRVSISHSVPGRVDRIRTEGRPF